MYSRIGRTILRENYGLFVQNFAKNKNWVKNKNFGQKYNFLSKILFLSKIQTFCQKYKLFVKNINFLSKIQTLDKNKYKFLTKKNKILVRNNFWSNIQIVGKLHKK